ncbi:DNRLRE domain-containing protein [Paenibacillus sp. 276b]|uniref:DNRLRE domain-containing protein n=1 Tax=Paenibacillus sp. 276b TaxID=1566277 RepID=UPI00089D57B4|nr:DNRLRE domain-containing protein [Paenibacillus sp. 276b]SEA79535.1 F5/8 type C domain-containing protein [Paenibacillus sp. 276b]
MIRKMDLSGGSGGISNQSVYTSKNGVVVTSSANVWVNSNYYYMQYLFDGKKTESDATGYWLTQRAASTSTVAGRVNLDFDLTSMSRYFTSIDRIVVYPRTREDTISDYTIYGKVDASGAWEEIAPYVTNATANCPYGTARTHVINAKYKFIRFDLVQKGTYGVTLAEVEFYVEATDDYRDTLFGYPLATPDASWKRYDDTQAAYPNGYTVYNATGITGMYGSAARVISRSAANQVGTQDRIKFRFYGTKLRVLACTYTDRQQEVRVYINGVDQGTFTTRYSTANVGQVLVYERLNMIKAIHSVELVIEGTAPEGAFYFDAFDIDNDGYVLGEEGAVVADPDLGWTRYEQTHPAITYFPAAGWTSAALAAHTGGSAMGSVTTQKGNKMTFAFIGSKFRLVISKSPTYSPAIRVTIDGVEVRDFSARDSYFYHRVAGFQRENLPYGRHNVEVEVLTKPTNSDGYDFRFDAIDIDTGGRLLHFDEVLEQKDLTVGKRIRAHYAALAETVGTFSGLGAETSDFLPAVQIVNPDGDFYLIAVDTDPLGRVILLADRNVQGGMPWTTANDWGLMTGRVLNKQFVPTIPVLNSNTSSPDMTIIVSSALNLNYNGWRAFNGVLSGDTNRWVANNPAPSHLTVVYKKPRLIKHYSVRSAIYNNAAPKVWQIQGSNDGVKWFLLDERTNVTGLLTSSFYSFSNDTYYTMYRIHITATNGYAGYYSSIDALQFYEEDSSLSNAMVRLPTGGAVVTGADNEWDRYITGNTLGGKITAGDTRVWNWGGAWSMTPNTTQNVSSRTVRGNTLGGFSYISASAITVTSTGFRPLFIMYVSEAGNNSLVCEITVPVKDNLSSGLHVYQNHIEYKESPMIDVTVPVTATDLKGYAIESSGLYSNLYPEWLAFDNQTGAATYAYAPPAGQVPAWLIFDYGKPLNVAGYGIASRPSSPTQAPRDFKLSGSTDKVSWDVLDEQRSQPDWAAGGELRKFALGEKDKTYRYFKWDISNPSIGNQLGVQEFELYGFDDCGLDQRKTYLYVPYANDLVSTIGVFNENGEEIRDFSGDLTLPMTNATSNGYTLKASHNYVATGYNTFFAFNNVVGSGQWSNGVSNGGVGWLAINIVEPAIATEYLMEAPSSTGPNDMAKDWTFEGSVDGDNWTVLDTQKGQTTWSTAERRRYKIPNPTGMYNWFRVNVTANNGGWLTIGEIEIYGRRGAYFNQRKASIIVPYRNDLTTTITVKPHGRMKATAKVAPVYLADLASTIDVKWTSNVLSTIAVRPKGKMRAVVDVVPPPKIVSTLSPVKDAFTRSSVPRLNYGQEQEMLVGNTNGESFNSLIQFDVSTIPAGMKLLSAKLRLYVEQTSLVGNPVSFYQVENDWTELGVTWASSPAYGMKLAEIQADVAKEYAEVDMLSIVQGWYNGTLDNTGMFMNLDTISGEMFVRFGSRERGASYAPQLVIEYQDPTTRSNGYADVIAYITAQQKKFKDLATKITVKSYWDKSDIPGNFTVFNPDMLETFMKVTRGDIRSTITVKREDLYQLPSEIVVSNRRDSVVETNIRVSRDFMKSTLVVRHNSNSSLPSVVVVRNSDSDGLPTKVDVTRPDIIGGIEVTASSVLTSSITVSGSGESHLESVITIQRSESNDLNSTVEVWKNSDIDGSIIIKSGYLSSSITVPFGASKDLVTKIRVAERYASDLVTHIEVGGESTVLCTIVVVESDDGGYAFII